MNKINISRDTLAKKYPYLYMRRELNLREFKPNENTEKNIQLLGQAVVEAVVDSLTNSIDKQEYIKKSLHRSNFYTAPASAKYHGSFEGGLVYHSLNVAESLLELTVRLNLVWGRKESPLIIGLFHDLCKTDEYVIADTGGYKWSEVQLFNGHGAKSLHLLQLLGIELTEEEMACIRYHMGAFTEKDEWKYYSNAIHQYPNVLATHTADMMAAHIIENNDREETRK